MVQGDCESRNAGMQNGMRNGSTKVKFSVSRAQRFIKLVYVSCEASDGCHEVIIYLTRVNQENDHTSMVVYHS